MSPCFPGTMNLDEAPHGSNGVAFRSSVIVPATNVPWQRAGRGGQSEVHATCVPDRRCAGTVTEDRLMCRH